MTNNNPRAIIHGLYAKEKLKPFSWGKADCIHWCGDCALAITGDDPIAAIRNAYKTERGSLALMTRNGCANLDEVARKAFTVIPVALARDGDWALILNPDGTDTLGVVVGSQIISRTKEALGIMPLTAAQTAYAVVTRE